MASTEIEVLPLYYDYVLNADRNFPVVVLVGGRNSGKSFFMEQLAVINLNNKKDYKLLVVEDVETNIGEGVKSGIEGRMEEFGVSGFFSATKMPPEIKHSSNGNNVIFKGYHSDKQQKQVKSLNEITAIWYEEAENITYKQFKALRMQLRGGDPADRQLFLTMNPVVSDGFVNDTFFRSTPDEVLERFPDGRPKVFVKHMEVDLENDSGVVEIFKIPCLVVVSTYRDNKFLTPEQCADIEELKKSDPQMYEMLGEGKFIKPAGTFFREFNSGVHVIEPFPLPKHWQRFRFMDYGLDMTATYWIAIDTEANGFVYKELYEPDLIISSAAAKIVSMTKEPIRLTYAPPDLWNRRQETGKSAADIFRENGVLLTKADNNREQGWLNVKEWIKPFDTVDEQTGEAKVSSKLKIFSNCVNLIRTLPAVQRDPKDPNDVATEPHELTHAPDALRYFCIMRRQPSKMPQKPLREDGFYLPSELADLGYNERKIRRIK